MEIAISLWSLVVVLVATVAIIAVVAWLSGGWD